MLEPVTESLRVHWQPTSRYHLHRLDVLGEVTEAGLLEAFHVEPDHFGLRTDAAQLTMAEDGVSVYPRGSLLDEAVIKLLRSAFECTSPREYHFTLPLQFLIPIPNHSYDEARSVALDRMAFGPVDASDFAMLIEGKIAEDEWHCEFGILSEKDVVPRLRRWIGRMGNSDGMVPSFVKDPSDIAPVSFFADLVWLVPDRPGREGDSVEDIAHKIKALRDEANGIVSKLYAQVCEGALQPVAGGSDQ